jgi:hypothetical protein
MSAAGGKADVEPLAETSAFDPERTSPCRCRRGLVQPQSGRLALARELTAVHFDGHHSFGTL